jgi:hypothetical protein
MHTYTHARTRTSTVTLRNQSHCPTQEPTAARPPTPLPLPPQVSQLDLLLMHWPDTWLPGSDPKGPINVDAEWTLEDTWWAGLGGRLAQFGQLGPLPPPRVSVPCVPSRQPARPAVSPPPPNPIPSTPQRRSLEALVDEGLAKGLGVSNCSIAQVEAILKVARHRPLVNQARAARRRRPRVCPARAPRFRRRRSPVALAACSPAGGRARPPFSLSSHPSSRTSPPLKQPTTPARSSCTPSWRSARWSACCSARACRASATRRWAATTRRRPTAWAARRCSTSRRATGARRRRWDAGSGAGLGGTAGAPAAPPACCRARRAAAVFDARPRDVAPS